MLAKCIRLILLIGISLQLMKACLITNCPRGGKRSAKLIADTNIKPCISCGPGHSGQCFGPNICCGLFGCFFGTVESARCQREGNFLQMEPCIAGNSACRRNTGRCASDGICCSQDACFSDKSCTSDANSRFDIYNFINADYGA